MPRVPTVPTKGEVVVLDRLGSLEMSQGILAAAVHRWEPGSHIERIDTIFRSPIPVDARVTCRATVTDVDVARRTVEIDLTIATDDAETRVLGTATVRFD